MGHYIRDGQDLTWTDDMRKFIEQACATKASYGVITRDFNARFAPIHKSRSAVIGFASRLGVRYTKPAADKALSIKRKPAKRRKRFVQSGPAVLRDESDRGIVRERSRMRSNSDPVVIERKKGTLPSVIDNQPLTSIPIIDACILSCMWPTCEDVSQVCGERVTHGAYCARHASVAYRVMPTTSRQNIRGKQDVDYKRKIDGSHHRSDLDPDGAWLTRMILETT